MSNYRSGYSDVLFFQRPTTPKQARRMKRKVRRDVETGSWGGPEIPRVKGVPGHPGRRREYYTAREASS